MVDDEPEFVKLFQLNLGSRGYQVVTSGTAAGALSVLGERLADLVLLDFRLPGVDGMQFCRDLRASFPDMAVIVMSADARKSAREEAMKAGAMDYMIKPFGVTELLERVRVVLAHQPEGPNYQTSK